MRTLYSDSSVGTEAQKRSVRASDVSMAEENGKRKVVYLWPYREWGGAQIYFAGIMKLARERYSVQAVMPSGSAEKFRGYLQHLGIPCRFFDAHLDSSPAHNVWQKIRRRLRDKYCSLVIARHLGWQSMKNTTLHVDLGPWSQFWLLLYLCLRTNVFVTLHIGLPPLSLLRRYEFKLKFAILCMLPGFHLLGSNRDMIESLRPYVPGWFMPSVRLSYTTVNKDEINAALKLKADRASLCARYGLPTDSFFVFSLGQLIQRKGCLVLLEAVRQLRASHPSLFFVWIGTGSLKEQAEQRIKELGLESAFRIITPEEIGAERLDLLELLRLADLFVLPTFSEGLPIALLEAMALGKASISTSVNAIPEAIIDHETGLLVPPGDSAKLAAAIAELSDEASLRERLARAGQAHVLACFDEHQASTVAIEFYETCWQGQ